MDSSDTIWPSPYFSLEYSSKNECNNTNGVKTLIAQMELKLTN